jgi:hypothetical protein
VSLEHAIELDAILTQGVHESNALLVGELPHVLDVEAAPGRRRSEKAAAEACALLVRPVHYLDGDRWSRACKHAQRLEPGENAQYAIEPATVRH